MLGLLRVLGVAVILFTVANARADDSMTAGKFLDIMATSEDTQEVLYLTTYAIGIMHGIGAVNGYSGSLGEGRYYCAPDPLPSPQPLLLELLREMIRLDQSVKDYPVSAVALFGLIRRYPC